MIPNRHDRRKVDKLGNTYQLTLIHKKTKKNIVVNYKAFKQPSIDYMLKALIIDKLPVKKDDYNITVNCIKLKK